MELFHFHSIFDIPISYPWFVCFLCVPLSFLQVYDLDTSIGTRTYGKYDENTIEELTTTPFKYKVLIKFQINQNGRSNTENNGFSLTLKTSLICILLSGSRDVHFDKRMICFLSGLFWKAHQSQNHKGKHIISRIQRFYVIFKSSLYVILWYAFMNRLTVLAGNPYHTFFKKHIMAGWQKNTYQTGFWCELQSRW